MSKTKAIGLLSGGLDSTLATKLMIELDIEVIAINFLTPFCTCTRKGCKHEANRVAREFGIEIKIINAGEEYIQIVKNPKYGYGKNMNPCLDCRIFMLKKAKEFMKKEEASFLFTGEVLNQRPMSQRKDLLRLIEKESNLEGLILRPLSAKFLKPTIPEEEGLVDREKMLKIKGRSRKMQISLAEALNVYNYPCPAGGCRLTDFNFAGKIRDSFEYEEDTILDMHLLKYGRHFRLPGESKLIVGRNERENEMIARLSKEDDLMIEALDCKGPLAVLRRENYKKADLKIAARICATYCDGNPGRLEMGVSTRNQSLKKMTVQPLNREKAEIFKV